VSFEISFYRFNGEDAVDGDRQGLQVFLQSRNLRHDSDDNVVDHTGEKLQFDGRTAMLHLSKPDSADPIGGLLTHAGLTASECEFVYHLCAAAKFLICNHQGDPTLIVPAHTHTAIQASVGGWPEDPKDTVWVDSPEELQIALSAGLEALTRYRLGDNGVYHEFK
jgi:hypothetical protein